MEYKEIFERVLKGRSVNSVALQLGIPQKSLDRYVKGETVPGCKVARILAKEAGIPLEDVVDTIAEKEDQMARLRQRPLLPRVAAAAAMVLVLIVNLFLTPKPAEAAPRLASNGANTLYYVKYRRRIRELFAAVWTWFKRRPPGAALVATAP